MKALLLLVGGATIGVALGFVALRVSVSVLRKLSENAKDENTEDLSLEEMMVEFAEMPPATPFVN